MRLASTVLRTGFNEPTEHIVVQDWDLQCYFQGCVLFIFIPSLDLQQASRQATEGRLKILSLNA